MVFPVMCIKQGNESDCDWYTLLSDETQKLCEYCAKNAFFSDEINEYTTNDNTVYKCAMAHNSEHIDIIKRLYIQYHGLKINANHITSDGTLHPLPLVPVQISSVMYIQIQPDTFWSLGLSLYGMYTDIYWIQYTLRNKHNKVCADIQPERYYEKITISPNTIFTNPLKGLCDNSYTLTVTVFKCGHSDRAALKQCDRDVINVYIGLYCPTFVIQC